MADGGRGETSGVVSRASWSDTVEHGASERLLVKQTKSPDGLAREVAGRRMAPYQAAAELARAGFAWFSIRIGWGFGSSVG